jgi:hypothetical protein
LIFDRRFEFVFVANDDSFVEPLDIPVEFFQVSGLQPVSIYGFEYRHYQVSHFKDERFEFSVKGRFPKVVIHITNEV